MTAHMTVLQVERERERERVNGAFWKLFPTLLCREGSSATGRRPGLPLRERAQPVEEEEEEGKRERERAALTYCCESHEPHQANLYVNLLVVASLLMQQLLLPLLLLLPVLRPNA